MTREQVEQLVGDVELAFKATQEQLVREAREIRRLEGVLANLAGQRTALQAVLALEAPKEAGDA